jgi:hypothetical protein
MSELTNPRNADLRRQLLATVSTLALAVVINAPQASASDDDSDNPVVWIELGGQLEKQSGQGDAFIPSFITKNAPLPGFKGVDFQSQTGNNYANGFEGKLTFQPENSDWVFSASALYGRANSTKILSHITPGHHLTIKTLYVHYSLTNYDPNRFGCCKTIAYTTGFHHAYANMKAQADYTHAVLDFMAGKDVGLGMFGHNGSSVISAGVRFAQFTSRANVTIHGRPDREFVKHYIHYGHFTYSRYRALATNRYSVIEDSKHDFHGVGPAISWNASASLLGHPQNGELGLDWGVNAAVLFGKQSAAGEHHTSTVYVGYNSNSRGHYYKSGGFNRRRTVTVPNLGGFAGLSFRYSDAKISLGYRGDFFFGAMDAGNDTRKSETVGFSGPFATLSVGLGG